MTQLEKLAFPLSKAQNRLWILSNFSNANIAYNMVGVIHLSGVFNQSLFIDSVNFLIARHEILRTTFNEIDGNILAVIHDNLPPQISTFTLDQTEKIDYWIKNTANHSFDLERGPLLKIEIIKITEEQYSIIINMHHIISDGWSLGIFIKECGEIYNSFIKGDKPSLPELIIQHADYVVWEQQQEEVYKKSLQFWKNKLLLSPDNSTFPLLNQRRNIQSFEGDLYQQQLSAEWSKTLKVTASKFRTTPFILSLAAYNILLHKYANQLDIIVGIPIANRDHEELQNVIGFLVGTLPIRSKIDNDISFKNYIEILQKECASAFDNKNVHFDEILKEVNIVRKPNQNPLFQTIFSYENIEQEELKWRGINTDIQQIEGIHSKFDLTFSLREKDGAFMISVEFAKNIFDQAYIKTIVNCYLQTVENLINNCEMSISKFSIVPRKLRDKMTIDWNNTTTNDVLFSPLSELFQHQVDCNPNSIAYQTSDYTLTYKELSKLVDNLIHEFEQYQLNEQSRVALLLSRDHRLLPCMLACLKMGITYIPLDPSYPEKRLSYILDHADITSIITNISISFDVKKYELIDISKDNIITVQKNCNKYDVTSNDSAYIIYTSGSTGTPKGVEVSQGALSNFILSMQKRPGFNQSDKLLALTSTSFDISGLELFLPIVSGGTTILASEEQSKSPESIIELIEKFNISVMQATPSTWQMLREYKWKGNQDLKSLIGGESLPADLASWATEKTKEVWNMFGPTETTIWSTTHKCITTDTMIKIGMPIDNTQCYVLDDQMQVVPPYVIGNLYISGKGLAKGYFKDDKKTNDSFFTINMDNTDHLVYKTGDLAYYNEDGTLVHKGRIDFQVKVNGYRIELDEINYALDQHDEIYQAYCIVETVQDDKKIIAYLRAKKVEISIESVREHLSNILPNYMIPREYRIVKEFPMTPNGKIDREKFSEVEHFKINDQEYTAANTYEEKIITSIWEEILGIEKIGIDDNFFNLGGASIQSVKVSSKALEKGLLIKPEDLFEFPTIRQLAIKADLIKGLSTGSSNINQDDLQMSEELMFDPSIETSSLSATITKNLLIESFAHYEPSTFMSSREIIEGCINEVRFPMERLTGIRNINIANEEGTFDLAVKAVEKCINLSKYTPENIDLILVCNIFRMTNDVEIEVDPSISIRLKKHFGCINAQTYDISNACSGLFTGLLLADSFIKSGNGKRCMIVSGEFISHVLRTSQREVVNYMDPRLSGLTVGDSGFAMIVENTSNPNIGFKYLDFFTMGTYSNLCIVKNSTEEKGGMVVTTDAIRMAEAGHIEGSKHALKAMKQTKWTPEMIDFIIMHQASSTTIANAMSQINKLFGKQLTNTENVINNLENRGNTATTTHWIATLDNIKKGKITDGKNIIFCISGSGLNLGTALYTFDDLPSRINALEDASSITKKEIIEDEYEINETTSTIIIDSVAVSIHSQTCKNGIDLLISASKSALQESLISKENIETIIYTGIHRDEYTYEPAIATFLAGSLEINSSVDAVQAGKKTVALDIYNGDLGFLNACFVAQTLIQSDNKNNALISLSEIDNNKRYGYKDQSKIKEAGASVIVKKVSSSVNQGFGKFCFKSNTALMNLSESKAIILGPKVKLESKEASNLEDQWIALINEVIKELLQKSNLSLKDINHIIPPQRGTKFREKFKLSLNDSNINILFLEDDFDYKGMSTPFCIEKGLKEDVFKSGEKAIFIGIAGGLQAGAAIYTF